MSFLAFLVVGIVAGYLASVLVKGHGLGGIGDFVVGIIGAFVGGFLFNAMGIESYGFWGALGMSVVGAVVFLLVVGLFTGPRHIGRRGHL